MRMFECHLQERFALPYADEATQSGRALRRLLHRVGLDRLAAEWPSDLSLYLHRTRKSDRTPDIYTGGLTSDIFLQARHIPRLFPANNDDVEFLPISVEGVPWCIVNPCRRAAGWNRATSDVTLWHAGIESAEDKIWFPSHWITVIDPHPETLDIFYISGLQRSSPYFNEHLVDRIKALGLKGLDFKLIGEIVSDPALASPAPPRPPATPQRDVPSGRGPKLHLKPLNPQEVALIEEERAALIGLSEDPAAIEADIAALEVLFASSDAADGKRFAGAMQQLHLRIGELLRKRLGWSWQAVVRGRSQRFLAVASPNGAFAVSGGAVVMRQLQTGESSLQLLLNLITAGQLPPVQTDRVTMLQ